jgi:hypothetical protein
MTPRQEIARRLAAASQTGLLSFAAFGLVSLPLDQPDGSASAYFLQCCGMILFVGGAAVAVLDPRQPSWRAWAYLAEHRFVLVLPSLGFLGLAMNGLGGARPATWSLGSDMAPAGSWDSACRPSGFCRGTMSKLTGKRRCDKALSHNCIAPSLHGRADPLSVWIDVALFQQARPPWIHGHRPGRARSGQSAFHMGPDKVSRHRNGARFPGRAKRDRECRFRVKQSCTVTVWVGAFPPFRTVLFSLFRCRVRFDGRDRGDGIRPPN